MIQKVKLETEKSRKLIIDSPIFDEKLASIIARIENLNKKNLDFHKNNDTRMNLLKTLIEELSTGTTDAINALK